MSSVFISYVRGDQDAVARLAHCLELVGIQVLWDQNPELLPPRRTLEGPAGRGDRAV